MKYFLVGIKGAGMSALALLLHDLGHEVIGSDVKEYFYTEDELVKRKIQVLPFGNIKETNNKYLYIIGEAFNYNNNIDVKMIMSSYFDYVYYSSFLMTIFKNKINIGIAGTHGKTTLAKFFLNNIETNAIVGDGEGKGGDYKYFTYEACEYQNHFLKYKQKYGIITSIELDHPDFFSSLEDVKKSFMEFANKSEIVIANGDDENIRDLNLKNALFYGFKNGNDLKMTIINKGTNGFLVEFKYKKKKEVKLLKLYGDHSILNYGALYLFSKLEKIKLKDILTLPKRRFFEKTLDNQTVFLDYAHHPSEIKALYNMVVQKYPGKKICLVFEPHTSSRTKVLFNEFLDAFYLFDQVYLTEIFASARNDIEGFSITKFLNYSVHFHKLEDIDEVKKLENFVIVFSGAGNIDKIFYDYTKSATKKVQFNLWKIFIN